MSPLVINQALEEAVYNAMVAVETGRFSKVIKLLEYIKLRKEKYDIVMVNYALLISYMNVGQLKKAQELLLELDGVKIENEQIKKVIEQVKEEIKKNKLTSAKEMEKIDLDIKKVTEFAEKHPEDGIWLYYLEGLNGDKESYSIFYIDYKEAMQMVKFFKKEFIKTEKMTEDFTQMFIFNFLLDIEANPLFWFAIKESDFEELFSHKDMSLLTKKFFFERYNFFVEYNMYKNRSFTIDGNIYDTNNFKEFPYEPAQIAQEINSILENSGTDFNEELYETTCTIVKIIRTELVFEGEKIEKNKLVAITSYILNNLFIGREIDKFTKIATGYKFDDIRENIINIKNILTFLLSE